MQQVVLALAAVASASKQWQGRISESVYSGHGCAKDALAATVFITYRILAPVPCGQVLVAGPVRAC